VGVPLSLVIKNLTGFCVCHFKNINHAPESPPHYYVTIPIEDDLNLLLCVITSQIENRVWYYRRINEKAISCLVRLDKDSFSFIEKESIIDCNRPFLIPKNELSKIVDPNHKFKVVVKNIPSNIKTAIIKAINNSPIVKPFIKKLLKAKV
jgi:hypothetical protein